MGLHLGSSKPLRITATFGTTVSSVRLIIPPPIPVVDTIKLLSSDNFILTDSNGVYLATKEIE